MTLTNIVSAAEMTWRLLTLDADFDNTNLDSLLRQMEPGSIHYARHWQQAESIRSISTLLVRRLRQPGMGACLKLALLRYEQLRKQGFNVVFHLGVKPSQDGVTGHAWLTLNEEPLWEEPATLVGFRETYRFPRDLTGEAEPEVYLRNAA